jgi:ribonuclease Z
MSAAPAEFEHAGIRLVGSSIAGSETFVAAPELNLAFDVGRVTADVLQVEHIFLSHGHIDHSAGTAYYFAQRMFLDNCPGTMYLPAPLLPLFRELLRLWSEIDGGNIKANLVAAHPGHDIALRRDLLARPFEVNHPVRRRDRTVVPALGYSIIEVRKKLRDEFVGLEGPQLVELKKKGVEIEQRIEVPLIAYCGDTAPGPFLDLPHVRNAKILLLECTFVDPDHRNRAQAGNHMHISYLRDVVPRLNNEKILLIHLTRRTHMPEARERLRHEIGDAEMRRVSFLMEHRRRRRRPSGESPATRAE